MQYLRDWQDEVEHTHSPQAVAKPAARSVTESHEPHPLLFYTSSAASLTAPPHLKLLTIVTDRPSVLAAFGNTVPLFVQSSELDRVVA